MFLLWLRQSPGCGTWTPDSIPPSTEGRSSPSHTPVFPPSSFIVLSFVWFYIFFSTGQVLLSALSWCSTYTSVSEGVFLMYICNYAYILSTILSVERDVLHIHLLLHHLVLSELAVFECVSFSYLSFPECIGWGGSDRFLKMRVHYYMFSLLFWSDLHVINMHIQSICFFIESGGETQCITNHLNTFGSCSLLTWWSVTSLDWHSWSSTLWFQVLFPPHLASQRNPSAFFLPGSSCILSPSSSSRTLIHQFLPVFQVSSIFPLQREFPPDLCHYAYILSALW